MKIETKMIMIQNSIFSIKRIDERNGWLHQHKSTFVVINYYQGFKPPVLRLVLREFERKNGGRFGWTTLVRNSNGAHASHPKRISIKFTTKPRTKQNKAVTDTQYIQQGVHTYEKLLNNQWIKASICPFFVLHQRFLHAKLAKPSEALTRCYAT